MQTYTIVAHILKYRRTIGNICYGQFKLLFRTLLYNNDNNT